MRFRRTPVQIAATLRNGSRSNGSVVESMCVQRMHVAQWRDLRVWDFEQVGIASSLEDHADQIPSLAHLESFVDLHGASQNASLLAAENRFLRQYDQALAKLAQLGASSQLKIFKRNRTSASK